VRRTCWQCTDAESVDLCLRNELHGANTMLLPTLKRIFINMSNMNTHYAELICRHFWQWDGLKGQLLELFQLGMIGCLDDMTPRYCIYLADRVGRILAWNWLVLKSAKCTVCILKVTVSRDIRGGGQKIVSIGRYCSGLWKAQYKRFHSIHKMYSWA
jgi:hypothetical protein